MSEEELKQAMHDFGALSYDDDRIASILGMTAKEVGDLMEGDALAWYITGRDKYEYQVDKKLMAMSMSGDIKALGELKLREKDRARNKK